LCIWSSEKCNRIGEDIKLIRIDCYLSPECASRESLKANIDRALELEEIEADVTFSVVDETEANKLGLKGSPSILINGSDIQPVETPGFA